MNEFEQTVELLRDKEGLPGRQIGNAAGVGPAFVGKCVAISTPVPGDWYFLLANEHGEFHCLHHKKAVLLRHETDKS